MKNNMPVFLTGATGFVGGHLAARLVADGHRIKCLVRRPDHPGATLLKDLGAELTAGDILDPDTLREAATGCGAAIHLVGIIMESPGFTFRQVHVEGARNVLAAAAAAGIRHYVHMSALGAGPDAPTEYFRTKWQAEEAVRSSGLDYTIFRPSIIYGPRGEFINMLLKQVRLLPLVPVIGDGNYHLQPVSVNDVAFCFSRTLADDGTIGEEYELGGPEALTYNQIVDAISAAMGKKRFKLRLPLPLVRPGVRLLERLLRHPPVTTDQLKMLLAGSVCDIARMRQQFGIEPIEFEAGIKQMLA